ncbi:hypothetical protein ROP_30810 [Rhodococcus opacus B4]|uniref:Uncharacterized protein n=1 Tax=Rhodococcus opacus (strain B4) TaxID=632772 RepID=C1B6M5_RHOOB|nr:hypothetical protein ROP_30810 [Rhodococcus opacus B4]
MNHLAGILPDLHEAFADTRDKDPRCFSTSEIQLRIIRRTAGENRQVGGNGDQELYIDIASGRDKSHMTMSHLPPPPLRKWSTDDLYGTSQVSEFRSGDGYRNVPVSVPLADTIAVNHNRTTMVALSGRESARKHAPDSTVRHQRHVSRSNDDLAATCRASRRDGDGCACPRPASPRPGSRNRGGTAFE